MLLLLEVSFSVINNLRTPSSELQINFGVLQIDTENSATGGHFKHIKTHIHRKPKLKNFCEINTFFYLNRKKLINILLINYIQNV